MQAPPSHPTRRWRCLSAALAVALVGSCIPLSATSLRVNTPNDMGDAVPGDGLCEANPGSGDCTLRAAVQEANALVGDDDISVPSGTYILDLLGADEDFALSGDLDILAGTRMTCDADDSCIIDGGDRDRCLHVHPGGNLIIEGFVLTRGLAAAGPGVDAGRGGLIAIQAAFTNLKRMTVTLGSADQGGAIAAWQGATLQGDTVKISACSARLGGAVHIEDAAATFVGSLISDCFAADSGGGLLFERSTGGFSDGTLSGNGALRGGGVALRGGSTASLEGTILAGNQALSQGGGVMIEDGRVNLSATRCEGNTAPEGAGLALRSGSAELFKSSVTGNVGFRGAGVWADGGTLTSINATIAENKATGGSGGGILLASPGSASALLSFTTITANSALDAGGLSVEAGLVTMLTTILGGNGAATFPDGSAADGQLVSRGYNIVGDPAGLPVSAFQPEDILGADPMLAGPSSGRGFSIGLAPRRGSPAIDAADPAGCVDLLGQSIANDQQGEAKPTDGDGDGSVRCDIGAIEWCGEDLDANGVGDKCGCVPGDTGSIVVPPEPLLMVARIVGFDHPLLTWTDLSVIAGEATTYEVAGDSLDALWQVRAANGPCRIIGLRDERWEDVPMPPEDQYYLVRGVNACGPLATQGWGKDSLGNLRLACP